MRAEIFYHGNDAVLEVSNLQNAVSLAYINDANVTATLYNSSEVAITGQAFPLTLAYIVASNGTYRGTLSKDLVTSSLRGGYVVIDIDAGTDLVANFRIPVEFKYRRS